MLQQGGYRTLAELCEARAATHGDRVAVRDDAVALTYAELARAAGAVASYLRARGVRRADRVLVQGRNRVDWVVAAYGVLLAGATVVPLDHRVPLAERRRLVDELRPRLALLEDEAPGLPDGAVPSVRLSVLAGLPATRRRPAEGVLAEPDDPALVICTSGTSGRVKAVPMTHRQLLRLYDDVRVALDARVDDVWACIVPLTHSFGFNGVLLVAQLAGATVRLVPDYAPGRFAALLAREPVSVLAGPLTIYRDLADAGPGSAAGVRLAIVGSTEVSATEMARLGRSLGVARMATGYGMTETCGTVAIGDLPAAPTDPVPLMALMPGVEARVCDELGAVLPAGERGRIQVRGYNVCRPCADAPGLLPDGWLDTGDVGELEPDGRLAITGRADDLLNLAGFTVHPREVESALREHEAVAAAAVVAVRDRRHGQRLVGCVVASAPSRPPREEELVAFLRTRLSPYKVPGRIMLLDRLPTSATGKVSRAALRRSLEAEAVPGAC